MVRAPKQSASRSPAGLPKLTRCWKPIAPRSSSAKSSRSNSTSFTTPSPGPSGTSRFCTARASMARKWPSSPVTQQILEAAEAIDNAATALSKVTSPDQQKLLSEEIQERVVSIFEACNFQDLTGQRINKVMTTVKFIENHITVMMDIWGGIDAIKAHVPAIIDTREGDHRLLNGPKAAGDVGHASQDDIDALFD